MTAPDRIQITHQPRTMTTPRTALTSDEHNQWESLNSADQLAWAQARAIASDRALSQETSATGELTDIQLWELLPKRLEQNLLAMVQLAAPHYNLEPIDLLQDVAPDFVDYARAILARRGPLSAAAPAPGENLATPPAPDAPGEALAARPLLEKVARLDSVGITVAEVQRLARQVAAWLRSNPPGQPVAIEPRGCPTPGACSCVEPIPPAPEPGEVGELVGWLNQVAQYLVDTGVTGAPHVRGAAILLAQQEAELAALRGVPGPIILTGFDTFLDAIRLAEGCHDYSGGYTGAEGEAWHGAIDTVVAVLKKATDGPWDGQLKALYGVGVEAQAGELAVPEPVSECPHCGYEGEMVPVTQAGEVEA